MRCDLVCIEGTTARRFYLRRRGRRIGNPGGLLARFRQGRWMPLTAGRRGALQAWNPALAKLKDKSGVYVLRDKTTGTVVYVGESHTDRLYRTMLRHFQDPSGKFERLKEWVHKAPGRLEVLVFVTPRDKALEVEKEAVMYYEPLVNKPAGEADPDDVPF